MAKQPSEELAEQRIRNQVNKTIEVSEVLSGKKPLGGRLGDRIRQQELQEATSLSKGKQSRINKFKAFDEYLDRLEFIVNDSKDEVKKDIKVERVAFISPKNPDALL